MLPDSPDYPFLIAPSSCVLYVSSFSGLSILDYTIGITNVYLFVLFVDHLSFSFNRGIVCPYIYGFCLHL